ncbi:MAG: Fur family transcriptional regulator [Salaquimonas sp.]
MHKQSKSLEALTRNQNLVLNVLKGARKALSAYTILDQLRDEGLRAPLQVYRALDKLVETGIVHKLESMNAFIACSHPNCGGQSIAAFGICDDCSEVFEIADAAFEKAVNHMAQSHSFNASKAMIELHGVCHTCQQKESN